MRRSLPALTLLLTWLPACGPEAPAGLADAGGAPCQPPRVERAPADANLVMIVDDTMRRDAVGAYGGAARTPAFDAFAAEGILFENAVSQAPWTKPSVATLFTGLYPTQHGCTSHPSGRKPGEEHPELVATDRLADELVTLAEVLRGSGRATAAFVSNPWMTAEFGFDQGFDLYDDTASWVDTPGAALTDRAVAWLWKQDPAQPFFLYVHYIDSHMPYGDLERSAVEAAREQLLADRRPLARKGRKLLSLLRLTDGQPLSTLLPRPTRATVEWAYDRGVEDFDDQLAALLAALRAHPAWRRTAVVVTSDHGEALYERGYGNHGRGLYDDELAVPLAVRLPGKAAAGQASDCLVGLLDVMPSLCGWLDLDCPVALAGRSFLGPAAIERRYLVTEGLTTAPEHRALRDAGFKLMYEPRGQRDGRNKGDPWSLFDLAADPGEKTDLLATDSPDERARAVFERMQAALPGAVPPFAVPEGRTAELDPVLEKRLRELGYLDADAAGDAKPAEP